MLYNFNWIIPKKLAGLNMPGRKPVFGHDNLLYADILKDITTLKNEHEIDILVSIIEKMPDSLVQACESVGIKQLFFKCDDYGIPEDLVLFKQFINVILLKMNEGNVIACHCGAGQGRTGFTTACILGKYLKLNGNNAITELRKVKHSYIETAKQENFVRCFLKE
jgi:protein-tyrosine phosphatase